MTVTTSSARLRYLDWLRGSGALIMLQGHVFHSFLRNDLRSGGTYIASQFVGGMPPAIFLFLTGVTLAFMMDGSERKGVPPGKRLVSAFSRCGYLFFLAFVFRLQLCAFAFSMPLKNLMRVDILNCMGFSIAVMSILALFSTPARVRAALVAGLTIAFASPIISQMDWSHVPWLIRNYIVPSYDYFAFFPWGAYLAFGVSAGSAIRAIPNDSIDRAMQWCALLAVALIVTCQFFGNVSFSVYSKSEYWLNSPAQVLTKQGVTLLLLALAFVWTRYVQTGWSLLCQFGTTSLLVYWVHIELVYGRWLGSFKTALTVGQTALAAICVIGLMLALSLIRTNWDRIQPYLLRQWAAVDPIGKLKGAM